MNTTHVRRLAVAAATAATVLIAPAMTSAGAPVDGGSAASIEASTDDTTFILLAGSNETFEEAVARHVGQNPDQASVIEPVLSAVAEADTKMSFGDQTVEPTEVDSALAAVNVQANGQGEQQREAEPEELAQLARANPVFNGRQRINAFQCGTRGCVLLGYRVHDAFIDLGSTTAKVNGKTSGTTGWSGVTAVAVCQRSTTYCGSKEPPEGNLVPEYSVNVAVLELSSSSKDHRQVQRHSRRTVRLDLR